MMDEPRVTFLMPVLNGMPWLTETLASIEGQTYRNFEILVWDNGSSDGTLEELNRWIPQRIPGRVVADHPLSLGDSAAALVENATTEFCARIDSDDVNLPSRLEKQVAFMIRHPEVGFLACRCEHIDETGQRRPAHEFPVSDAELRWALRWGGGVHHSASFYRRSVLLRAGNYRHFNPGEDYDLHFRAARVAESCSLTDVLVLIRRHGRNTTAGINDFQPYFDQIAKTNAAILFEGLSAEEGIDLRDKVADVWRDYPRVSLIDLRRLSRAATLSAIAAGKPANYFKRTTLYQLQWNSIVRRLLAQRPIGRVMLRLKRAVI